MKNKKHRVLLLGAFVFCISFIVGCGNESTGAKTNIQQAFLPVDEAFVFSAKSEGTNLIKVSWKIAEGYRLYKDKFKFSVSPASYQIVDVAYPPAEMFSDKNLGEKESYSGSLNIQLKLSGPSKAEEVVLTSLYQGCADVGLCYPPETRKTTFLF